MQVYHVSSIGGTRETVWIEWVKYENFHFAARHAYLCMLWGIQVARTNGRRMPARSSGSGVQMLNSPLAVPVFSPGIL